MDRLLSRLVGEGRRRGLFGGSRPWMAIGATAWVVRRARRTSPDVVYVETLEPGARLEIFHAPPTPTRRERRRARRLR